MDGDVELDVVICTYDGAPLLDRSLGALGRQRAADGAWRVTVVDNNSTDDTAAVVERHRTAGLVPGLRRVSEPTQGLTPARRRGVAETTAPWIAFVDDDCVVDPAWVAAALAFARDHPAAAGFGGRVVPTYVQPPPAYVAGYGWAFAEQDLGDAVVPVDCLVGAGMVVNRAALVASGWVDEPHFADRVGHRLVSGGDVEIALRLAGTGRTLWYTPACRIDHVIPANRTAFRYLVRMTHGLGVSAVLAGALTWRRGRRAWLACTGRGLAVSLRSVARRAQRLGRGRDARRDVALAASYELGRWVGSARVTALLVTGSCPWFASAGTGCTSVPR